MKTLLSAIACLLLSTIVAIGQDSSSARPPRYSYTGSELIIGHGMLPSAQLFSYSRKTTQGAFRYRNDSYTGALFAAYRYHLSNVISLGMAAAFEQERGEAHTAVKLLALWPGPTSYIPFRRTSYSIAGEVTFNYGDVSNGFVRFYSVIGIGYTYRKEIMTNNGIDYDADVKSVRFNAYAAPIAIRFGRKLGGFCELGVGYRGLLNYGLSYRF